MNEATSNETRTLIVDLISEYSKMLDNTTDPIERYNKGKEYNSIISHMFNQVDKSTIQDLKEAFDCISQNWFQSIFDEVN